MEICRSLPSEPLGEFGIDTPDSVNPCIISPIDQRFGRAAGGSEISGSDNKCKLCRCVSERAGVEVLQGTKFFGLVEASFADTSFVLFSPRRRSKLLVDLAGLRVDKLRGGERVSSEPDDRRLLSLALESPVVGSENHKFKREKYNNTTKAKIKMHQLPPTMVLLIQSIVKTWSLDLKSINHEQ